MPMYRVFRHDTDAGTYHAATEALSYERANEQVYELRKPLLQYPAMRLEVHPCDDWDSDRPLLRTVGP